MILGSGLDVEERLDALRIKKNNEEAGNTQTKRAENKALHLTIPMKIPFKGQVPSRGLVPCRSERRAPRAFLA